MQSSVRFDYGMPPVDEAVTLMVVKNFYTLYGTRSMNPIGSGNILK